MAKERAIRGKDMARHHFMRQELEQLAQRQGAGVELPYQHVGFAKQCAVQGRMLGCARVARRRNVDFFFLKMPCTVV